MTRKEKFVLYWGFLSLLDRLLLTQHMQVTDAGIDAYYLHLKSFNKPLLISISYPIFKGIEE